MSRRTPAQAVFWRFVLPDLRWLLALLAVGFHTAFLVGCAGDGDPPSSTDSPAPSENDLLVTIRAPYDGQVVVTTSLSVQIMLAPETDRSSVRITIDGANVDGAFVFVPFPAQLQAEGLLQNPGPHVLEVSARSNDGQVGHAKVCYEARPGTATVRQITRPEDVIGGPASSSRLGDFLIQNDRVQFVVQNVGQYFATVGAYGGNVIDADLVRLPWQDERDQLGAVAPGINLENTSNPTSIRIVSDGSDGKTAILEAIGPDDMLPTLNLSSIVPFFTEGLITNVPASANDRDLPVIITNRYILAPGADYLVWETDVSNFSGSAIAFYGADYINVSGDVELFSPGQGFGTISTRKECELLAWVDHDPAGCTLGYIPEIFQGSSSMAFQGLVMPVFGQNATQVLLGKSPPVYKLAGGASMTFLRWLVLGKDVGAVLDARNYLVGSSAGYGTVSGTVTRGGVPVAGARVAATQIEKVTGGARVIGHWITDASGSWSGTLEVGNYKLTAGLEGSSYPDGESTPVSYPVTVAANGREIMNFEFAPPALLRVRVTDENGSPVPAKVSLVGFDPAPDPSISDPALEGLSGVLSDPDRDPTPFGLVRVLFAGPDGDTGEVPIVPGEYAVVVSRGPEYSIDTQRVTLQSGSSVALQSRIARVIDSVDFASGDFHIHSIDSFDAPVPRDLRVKTLLAEGLDMFAATDHTTRIDYSDTIASLGAADLLASFIGEEITTFDIGHFNAYPVSASPERVNLGAVEWGGKASPGRNFPAYGAFDLSPSALMAAARAGNVARVVQLNHPNNTRNGYFSLTGIDTAQTPPRSVVPATLFRQDPSISNLFADGWSAMEIWRGFHDDWDQIFEENLGDYFNLLNQGIVHTLMSNSDTHSSVDVPTGGPRNYVGLGELKGLALAQATTPLAAAINQGRVVCSNGPYLEVQVQTATGQASLAPGYPTIISAPDGHARVHIHVTSPSWAPFDEIAVFTNTAPYPMPDPDDAPGSANYLGTDLTGVDVPRYAALPQIRLQAGVDFLSDEVQVYPGIPGASRLEADVLLDLGLLPTDAWVMVMARGNPGVSGSLFPVMPAELDSSTNETVDDLVDGNVGEGGVLALALANPLFVDVDGNGRYDPPGVHLSQPPPEGAMTLETGGHY